MRLDLACSHVVDCEHKTAPIDEHGGYYAVGTPAMRDHRINYNEARRISHETFETWTRRLTPRAGDLLLAREAPVGPIVRVPDTENVAPGQRTVLLRPDPSITSSAFLYYLLRSPQMQTELLVKAEGSTVHHLNVADIRALDVKLPPLPEQQEIAEVLGALDDKIAANTGLATTADELATMEFASLWPSFNRDTRTYDDIAHVSGGGTPSTKVTKHWGGGIQWATPTDVTALAGPYLTQTERTITQTGLEACASRLYPAGTILMTSRATVGAFAIAQQPTAVNQGFITVRTRGSVPQMWLFHEMRHRVSEFVSWANGATFLELSRGNFKRLPVMLSDDVAMARFSSIATALHARAANALEENRTLASTRDALLPQLMSGRLRARDVRPLEEIQ